MLSSAIRSLWTSRPSEDPPLHGLRALSLLMILGLHYWLALGQLGIAPEPSLLAERSLNRLDCGMDLFFVLSGFLIARMLKDSPTLAAGQFYWNRLIRIAPAFLIFVACNALVVLYFASLAGTQGNAIRRELIVGLCYDLLYLNNYAGHSTAIHLWSLGVEVQFYLVAPWIFWALRKVKWAWPLFLALALITPFALRLAYGVQGAAYQFTHLRMDSLAAGSLVAFLPSPVESQLLSSLRSLGALLAALALAFCLLCPETVGGYSAWRYSLQHVAFATLLWLALAPGALRFLLSARVWLPIARVSYGAYLWHMLAGGYGASAWLNSKGATITQWQLVVGFFVFVGMAILAGLVSFIVLESPLLQLRRGHRK